LPGFETGIRFPYTSGAVITSLFERETVFTAKWRVLFYFLKITVCAEAFAIYSGIASYVSSDLHRTKYILYRYLKVCGSFNIHSYIG
jgi:hypothetical protein